VTNEAPDTLKTRPSLLSQVRRGDEDGWSRFYEMYEDFFYLAARGAGLSHEESRDIVQEAMITVRNYIDHFTPDQNRARFRTWLRSIVQSRISDQFRRKARNPLEKPAEQFRPDETSTSLTLRIPNISEIALDRLIDGKLEQAILAEARRLVREEVRMLDYQVYDLFEVQELTAREVATSLNLSQVTVRVRAFRVRRAVDREVRRIVRSLDLPSGPR
jgi:RNA polymerase sigma factor (sigma-70 family)